MTKKLFGGSKNVSSGSNVSGFGALPSDLQKYFRDIAAQGANIANNPAQYFTPMGLTGYENTAGDMMNPENFGASVSKYLNPFRDIVTQDINKSFEGDFGALKQRADEAGAFGGSRYRMGQSDLERSKLDAISSALSGQWNSAANQYQQGISNLLGFGGLQRGVDLAQRQAPAQAVEYLAKLLAPLLGGSSGSQSSTGRTDQGIMDSISNLIGSLSSGGSGSNILGK